MSSNTVQNLQCLFACFKLYRICSVCLHASSCSRYCTESAVFVACYRLPPNTVQNKYCTESRVFACFKLLQILYRIYSVCLLQAAPDTVQNLFACFKLHRICSVCLHASSSLQILYRICSVCLHASSCCRYCTESVFACFKLLQMLYRIHRGRMLQAASRYCTECAVL